MSQPHHSTTRRRSLKSMATLLVFGVTMAVGIGVAVAISAYSMTKIRIGGATYERIVQTKDLVADILPPPLYIIEAYLEATRAAYFETPVADAKKRVAELRKDYDTRRAYWQGSDLDTGIRDKLTEASHAYVAKFWTVFDDKLVPALERKDAAAAKAAYAELTTIYNGHRAVIDQIVTAANALGEKVEADSSSLGRTAIWSVAGVDAALFLLLMIGIVAIIRRLVRPIGILGDSLAHLSSGDLTARITQKMPFGIARTGCFHGRPAGAGPGRYGTSTAYSASDRARVGLVHSPHRAAEPIPTFPCQTSSELRLRIVAVELAESYAAGPECMCSPASTSAASRSSAWRHRPRHDLLYAGVQLGWQEITLLAASAAPKQNGHKVPILAPARTMAS